MVTTAARNSRKLIDARSCSCTGMWNRHAKPSEVKPPMPHSHASE